MPEHPVEQSPIRPKPAQTPVELELGDGSRLVLEDAAASPVICRVEASDCERISHADALGLDGQPFAGYRRDRGSAE